MNALLALDQRAFRYVLACRPPRWVCWLTLGASRAGDGWGWLLVAAALLASGGARTRSLATAAAAAAVASALFAVLKQCFRRPRPSEVAAHPLFDVRAPDRFSFPSGHSMTAFAIATALALDLPLLAAPLAVFAATIAASRVMLGLHYVTDVVAGSALGVLVGAAVASWW